MNSEKVEFVCRSLNRLSFVRSTTTMRDDDDQGPPRPVQVVTPIPSNSTAHDQGNGTVVTTRYTLTLNEHALEAILARPDVRDKKVAVLSIAGVFREGKSFALNCLMHYLKRGAAENWLDDGNDDDLAGFAWSAGSVLGTEGIFVWSEPFIVKLHSTEEEVAVLLMDTQGTADCTSSNTTCSSIFALSTMISSVQIYNIFRNIDQNHLERLQFFAQYGQAAGKSNKSGEHTNNCRPFQTLTWLVRDWPWPSEKPFGFAGGEKLLNKKLQEIGQNHKETKELPNYFEKMNCFLMPEPGQLVKNGPSDQPVRLSAVDNEFKKQLKVLAPALLSPETLVLKKDVNGEEITCGQLLDYIRACAKGFNSDRLPEVETFVLIMAKNILTRALTAAKYEYDRGMKERCGTGKKFMEPQEFEHHHESCEKKSVEKFNKPQKMGGDVESYRRDLRTYIKEQYGKLSSLNEKNKPTIMNNIIGVVGLGVAAAMFLLRLL